MNRTKMKNGNIKQPQIKVIDMCFWQTGIDMERTIK